MMEFDRDIPAIAGPRGRISKEDAEKALRLADGIIEWAASVDPDRWSESAGVWRRQTQGSGHEH
jgi:hypothetical protein